MNTEQGTPNDTASPSESFWEEHYRRLDPAWGGRVNPVVAGLVGELAPEPGRVLDVGAGHGGDAVWFAEQGWRVTAIDVSQTALDRVLRRADEGGLGPQIAVERHDLARTLPEGTFDLVTAAYFQTPVALDRGRIIRRIAERVAGGGFLVVVDHASVAPWSWDAGRDVAFPTPEETLASFALGERWQVERCEAAHRVARGPGEQTVTVTDNVIVLRRT